MNDTLLMTLSDTELKSLEERLVKSTDLLFEDIVIRKQMLGFIIAEWQRRLSGSRTLGDILQCADPINQTPV